MYLGSGLIRGIGPKPAGAIVECFGEDTLKVFDADPDRLLECTVSGAGRRDKIVASWTGQKVVRDLMVVLEGFGISPLLDRLEAARGEGPVMSYGPGFLLRPVARSGGSTT